MSKKLIQISVKDAVTKKTQKYKVEKSRITLGSSTSSDIILDDPKASSIHAIVEVSQNQDTITIYDMASESGLKVNNKSTVQTQIKDSDVITIGDLEIQIGFNLQEDKVVNLPKTKPPISSQSFGRTLHYSETENYAPLLLEDESKVIEIFDHTTEQKQSLQVVMFYKDTILEVEHFTNKPKIVIGPNAKDDFCIPPFFGEGKKGRFELVETSGGQTYLHLNEKMEGVYRKSGKLIPITELMNPSQKDSKIQLSQDDFAKIKIGDVSFYLGYTSAPPKLKKQSFLEKDPQFTRLWFTSFLVTGLILTSLNFIKVNPTIEIEQLPERIATIIYDTSIKKEEIRLKEIQDSAKQEVTKPKVLKVVPTMPTTAPPTNAVIGEKKQDSKKTNANATPKSSKKQAVAQKASGQEGEGAKARGHEGTRGKQNAPKSSTAQTKAQRPGEGPKSNQASTNQGKSEVPGLGIVDVFRSNESTLAKVLSSGKGVSNAASKLEGYSGFTTEGAGGLGATSTGGGGGGQSMGLGGLSDKGPGGGKRGTGLGALGSVGNLLGGKGKIAIDSGGGGEPIVMGAIDTDAIAREIAKHRDEIKYCYEKEINADRPDLSGRVAIKFVIVANGTVSSAGVANTTLKNANTESCVVDVIKRIQFPPVRGGGIAEVTYPFLFKPSNK